MEIKKIRTYSCRNLQNGETSVSIFHFPKKYTNLDFFYMNVCHDNMKLSTQSEKLAKSGQKIPKTDTMCCRGLVFGHFGPLLTIFGLCAIKIKFRSCNCGPTHQI